jgi:hypothetical protein
MDASERRTIEEELTHKNNLFLMSGEIIEEESALEDGDTPMADSKYPEIQGPPYQEEEDPTIDVSSKNLISGIANDSLVAAEIPPVVQEPMYPNIMGSSNAEDEALDRNLGGIADYINMKYRLPIGGSFNSTAPLSFSNKRIFGAPEDGHNELGLYARGSTATERTINTSEMDKSGYVNPMKFIKYKKKIKIQTNMFNKAVLQVSQMSYNQNQNISHPNDEGMPYKADITNSRFVLSVAVNSQKQIPGPSGTIDTRQSGTVTTGPIMDMVLNSPEGPKNSLGHILHGRPPSRGPVFSPSPLNYPTSSEFDPSIRSFLTQQPFPNNHTSMGYLTRSILKANTMPKHLLSVPRPSLFSLIESPEGGWVHAHPIGQNPGTAPLINESDNGDKVSRVSQSSYLKSHAHDDSKMFIANSDQSLQNYYTPNLKNQHNMPNGQDAIANGNSQEIWNLEKETLLREQEAIMLNAQKLIQDLLNGGGPSENFGGNQRGTTIKRLSTSTMADTKHGMMPRKN